MRALWEFGGFYRVRGTDEFHCICPLPPLYSEWELYSGALAFCSVAVVHSQTYCPSPLQLQAKSKQDKQNTTTQTWPLCSELFQLGRPVPWIPQAPTHLQNQSTHTAYIEAASTQGHFFKSRRNGYFVSYKQI